MRDSFSRTVLGFVLGSALVAAPPAGAGGLPINNSISPPCIRLVGTYAGVAAHAAGRFTVVIRDFANNPVPGARVAIDLSGCMELHLCADQLDPAVVVNCPANMVSSLTAADGSVSLTLLGGSNGSGNAVSLQHGGKIYANGVLIGIPSVSAFDLDGASGVGINDLSAWLTDFGTFGSPAFERSDFDCSGDLGINDLSDWLTAFGSGAQVQSCGPTCP